MQAVRVLRGERGMALVMALLVLVVLSMLSAALLMNVNTETKIADHSQREAKALNSAEAGITEAASRIRAGDVPNNFNPRMVAQVFNVAAGSVPTLGPDSVGLATAQPAGQWLSYSTATRGPDVLTVQYKTNAARTVIYKYDRLQNPAIQTVSGMPIFVVNSTGRVGSDIRRIQAEIVQKPFLLNVKAALAAEVGIEFSGNSHTCGYDHSTTTPTGTRDAACQPYETGTTDLPGGWSCNDISDDGSSLQRGSPSDYVEHQVGFYSGPWDALSMSQAEFFQWVGARVGSEPSPPNGIYYVDNNGTPQDQSGSFAYHGGDGEGFMYVDGDLTINGNFNFRGLIYVEGDTKINGTFWCLGGLIVKGKTTIKHANGSAGLLFSSDAIQQALSKHGGTPITLSWKEL